jgi:cyclic-di-GMP phosphodiesterase TipF (flagellum assembly factor)
MRRISAIFIAVCMVLIACSIGAVLYLGLKVEARDSVIAALAALLIMALYTNVSGRLADRNDLGDQIADLSRGTGDLARQMAEMSRRVAVMEGRVDGTVDRVRGTIDPIATEIGELGCLVLQLAETVASHGTVLQEQGAVAAPPTPTPPAPPPAAAGAPAVSESGATSARHFRGLSREEIVALIDKAADAHRIDLYLQPVVTLPQRKVRYYEALSRLRTEDGDIVPAGEFIDIAESAGLMPRIDNLLLFRCVQVTRRLQLKNRDIGVFCNVCGLTLSDPVYFRHFLDFMDANRALSGALILEFTQKAYRTFGPIEHESLAALAERGFRFSMDHVADLRMEPKELADRWFRFLKVPAALLLNPAFAAKSDIHQGDLADLLARSGIDLIAERVETESMVVDLLDFDVRFGQGFLFSPPRPVRPESLQGTPVATQAAGELVAAGTG